MISGDIVVCITKSRLVNWVIGKYCHCFMMLEDLNNMPMIFESTNRGILMRTLASRYGDEVVIMRLRGLLRERTKDKIMAEVIKLASSVDAYYDYSCIPLHIIPRILNEKLGLPIPLKYHRNEQMNCAECVAEVFWGAGLDIVPRDTIPMPGDFVESPFLKKVWEGVLGE